MNIKSLINRFITKDVGLNGGKDRELWLEKALLKIPDGSKVLDAGAGEGSHRKYCSHLEYYSQDIAEYDGLGDEKGLHKGSRDYSALDIIADLEDLPIEKETFDGVMCIEEGLILYNVPSIVIVCTSSWLPNKKEDEIKLMYNIFFKFFIIYAYSYL